MINMNNSQITILWSTQGGRAKACARRTARILRESANAASSRIPVGYKGSSFDDYGGLEFFKLGNQHTVNGGKKLIVLFVSTTGDAEQCDSIKDTWKMLLQKSVPANQFKNIEFAMFCLGDRAYGPSAFCAAGRKLAARLVQLGAKAFCNIGYGDDGTPNGGVFSDLDVWLEKKFLQTLLGDRNNQSLKNEVESLDVMPDSSYDVKLKKENQKSKYDGLLKEYQMRQYADSYDSFFASLCPSTAYAYDDFRILESEGRKNDEDPRRGVPLKACVVSNKRITGTQWIQDTRHIRLHVSTSMPLRDQKEAPENASSMEGDDLNSAHKNTPPLPHMAGDIATIMPSNPKSTVDLFLSCLPRAIASMADTPLHISTTITAATQYNSSFTQWPKHATLRGILTYCADISNLPEREDLRALRFYCNPNHPVGIDQRKKLFSLSETKDAALYGDYILREKRNWADVLFDFDSIKYECGTTRTPSASSAFLPLTIEHLLMILPPIMPRHFSIASAPSSPEGASTGTRGYTLRNGSKGFDLELCVAVVEGTTRYGRPFKGLCSSYLSSLKPSDERHVRVWVRPGSFGKMPTELVGADPKFVTPIMCVGAGTGIAPLRSLIREREIIRKLSTKVDDSVDVSTAAGSGNRCDSIIVFGCRKKSMDYYYGDEWKEIVNRGSGGSNLRVLNAFSQDQKQKIYVQKVLREADDGLLIAKHILENNGAVYIAGGAKMARSVKDEIIESLAKVLPSGEKGAKILLQKLQRVGKFSVEAWS